MSVAVLLRGNMTDTIRWLVVLALVATGIWGFYSFSEHSLLLRVVALIATVAFAMIVSLQTEKGRAAWGFAKEARTEVRKVVWPSRTETIQTTGLIIVLVGLVGVFLWGLDTFFGWLTKLLLGS